MTEPVTRNLVVVITHGTDHEVSSVAFTIANGGMTAGLKVSVFLTSAAVDLVRKRAVVWVIELQSIVDGRQLSQAETVAELRRYGLKQMQRVGRG